MGSWLYQFEIYIDVIQACKNKGNGSYDPHGFFKTGNRIEICT